MWFVDLNKINCKNCYACVRNCPVNAIKIKDGKASIIKERCVVCGKCANVCHHTTKIMKSEKKLVKQFIKEKQKVIASVAPSFAAVYGENSNKIPTVLKKLGFAHIEETVVGVEPIMDVYSMYANKNDDNNYITSFCPSVTYLIQKHYPKVIENIIPVISPYICHARILKEKYGRDSKVVFIGPCLAKKEEACGEDSIDAVLTFYELDRWIRGEGIDIESLEEECFDEAFEDRRLFPLVGGATKVIKEQNPSRKIYYVNGIEECMQTLESIKNNKFKNVLFEMTLCNHSCISGSGMPSDNRSYYERKENLQNYVSKGCINTECKNNDLSDYKVYNNLDLSVEKKFDNLHTTLNLPNEEEITHILNSMGKYRKRDELDCGNCGYRTCREKAIAVYNGIAEISMCIPFMKEKSERLSNVIFDTTPNLIVIANEELDIIDMNPSARHFFGLRPGSEKNLPISMFIEDECIEQVRNNKINIIKQKTSIPYNKATVIQNILWLEESQVMVWIGDDVTKEEKIEKEYEDMKINAVDMAQKVINNQMVVAQEIASLLGETTAKTKVTLTHLKNLIENKEPHSN